MFFLYALKTVCQAEVVQCAVMNKQTNKKIEIIRNERSHLMLSLNWVFSLLLIFPRKPQEVNNFPPFSSH